MATRQSIPRENSKMDATLNTVKVARDSHGPFTNMD